MITGSWAALAGLIVAIGITLSSQPTLAAPTCPASPPTPALNLPHLKLALAKGQQGLVVALGSSSTEGTMASDPGRTYPADLQAFLSAALPSRHIAVINRGIGGQDARAELARLEADVIAVRPQLVIWQVGANAALRADNSDTFHELVSAGVRKLQAANIDVVLMDNQRSPKILASPSDAVFDQSLADIARETGVGLFSRNQLMQSWEREGAAPALFVATDGLHHNNLGYRCVAQALATDILTAVTPPALSASR